MTNREREQGHAAHSEAARGEAGFPGRMPRPIKVTFIGAGSMFTPTVVGDILQIPGADRGTIALVDIDRRRLKAMQAVIERLLAHHGRDQWTLEVSPDRRQVLNGTDYLVNSIEVSGLACVGYDNDIPRTYGVDQCIGDTIGPGGLFKGLRTIPVWLDILRDAEELCPHALVLNYTNPMNMLCLAAGRTRSIPVVGLCHSVQATGTLLARRLGLDIEAMEWTCAGINHLAWFTRLAHRGRDCIPRLREQAWQELYGDPAKSGNALPDDVGCDRVRKDVLLHFGAFVTESSGHLSEYLPYYRARGRDRRRYCRKGYQGESSFYRNHWPEWRKRADRERREMAKGDRPVGRPRSWEYASWIIEAREKDRPLRIHGNVMNTAGGGGPLIGNLPADGCVEVACMVDGSGIHPTVYGTLPPQMAGLCRSNMSMFDLAATAAVEKSKEAAIHALLLDPLTAACCPPARIKQMALEMFAAETRYLKGYR